MVIRIKKIKFLGALCLIISLLLLFSSWIEIKGSLIYNLSDYQKNIFRAINELENYISFLGIDINLEGIEKILSCLLDGKLTPVETVTLCKEIIPIVDTIKYYFRDSSNLLIELQKIYYFCYLYIILVGVTVLTGILSIYSRLREKTNKSNLIFFLLQLMLLIVFLLVALFLRNYEVNVRITVSAILSVIFALPLNIKEKSVQKNNKYAFYEEKIGKGKDNHENKSNKDSIVAMLNKSDEVDCWTCQNCGEKLPLKYRYCSKCGSARPISDGTDELDFKNGIRNRKQKPVICPNCGSQIEEDSSFCEICGFSLKN